MTILGDRVIDASTISEAWLDAITLLHRSGGNRKAVHLVARIRNPTTEVPEIRAEADRLIDEGPDTLTAVDTTRNTIFPASWARRNPEPEDLAAYYRDRYGDLKRFQHNEKGTYFGRVVAYPRADGTVGDQLTETVRKLRQELAVRGPKSSRYEINIYSEYKDTGPMSFPCLAHISVHLHDGALHMQAVYRNEYLIGRAYGNFLGLGQLLEYMANAAEVAVGELLMTINHAELDGNVGPVKASIDRLANQRVGA